MDAQCCFPIGKMTMVEVFWNWPFGNEIQTHLCTFKSFQKFSHLFLRESFSVMIIGIDYGKCGFIQDCFGESFNFMIIGIDYGKCGFIQDCFGESFNVMIIGIDYGKCGFIQDCFGESFNVMIIGIVYGKCGFIQDCFGQCWAILYLWTTKGFTVSISRLRQVE